MSLFSRPTRARAFSLAELMVVLAIVIILLSIFVPYVLKVRETDRRARCADNLRAIGKALQEYADRNARDYPRVRFDPLVMGFTAFTGSESPDGFGPGTTVQANDVTASLWLLAKQGFVDPARFVCPSADESADPLLTNGTRVTPDKRSNFTGQRHLSYSYASPFSTSLRFRLNSDVLPPDFAVAADKNPGTAGRSDVTGPAYDAPPRRIATANSTNHGRAGQNVLYADGHLQFQITPYAGFGVAAARDNIYTAASNIPLPPGVEPTWQTQGHYDPSTGPAWEKDSYLVPAADSSG